MGSRFGSVASEKGTGTEFDTGLGLRMQPSKSFCHNYKMMVPCHHQIQPTTAFGLQGCCCCCCSTDDGDCEPLFSNSSNHLSSSSTTHNNMFDVVADVMPNTMLLHHQNSDISNSTGLGGGGMVNIRIPCFTEAQRRELERQTMIYKYMMASVPVPPQLLTPHITKTTPSSFARFHHSNKVKGSLELGISNSSDPEPWRCRRTDGKKWRCSRDAVPDQKYCERHSHKSRPRSRKPVEPNQNSSTTRPYTKPAFLNHQSPPFSTTMASAAALHDQTRCLEWFTKGENEAAVDVSDQDWLKARSRMDVCEHQYEETGGFMAQETRHFLVDSWSVAAEREKHIVEIGSASSNDKFFGSSLSLSMSCGDGRCFIDKEYENDQMKSQWMNPASSWLGSPPGGPLAEALCLGIPASPGCNSCGTTSTTWSSS